MACNWRYRFVMESKVSINFSVFKALVIVEIKQNSYRCSRVWSFLELRYIYLLHFYTCSKIYNVTIILSCLLKLIAHGSGLCVLELMMRLWWLRVTRELPCAHRPRHTLTIFLFRFKFYWTSRRWVRFHLFFNLDFTRERCYVQ